MYKSAQIHDDAGVLGACIYEKKFSSGNTMKEWLAALHKESEHMLDEFPPASTGILLILLFAFFLFCTGSYSMHTILTDFYYACLANTLF